MGAYSGPEIVNDGLVLHLDAANSRSYPSSGTVWSDLSGNGNNGTLVNGVGYSADNKGAMTFDGVNDVVSYSGHTTQLNESGNFTLETTFKYRNLGNGIAGLLHFGTYTGSFLWNGGYLSVQSNGDNSGSIALLNEDQWYHTVCIFESGIQYKIYVDGNLIGTKSTTDNSYSIGSIGYIGRRFGSSAQILQGEVSDVKIYNRALTAFEIQQNFEATRSRYGI